MHDETKSAHARNAERGEGNAGVQQEVPLITFPLRDSHRGGEFRTGKSPEVEKFLKETAPDLARRSLAGVYVLEDPDDRDRVLGYYTLACSQLVREAMSNKHRSSLRRNSAPMALLGYMGRDDRLEKGKYGAWLVQDAARRAMRIRAYAGVWGLILEAENERLARWYERPSVGFKRCPQGHQLHPDRPLMYAPLEGFPMAVPAPV